ncbi:MAG: Trp family transcriptional regulator [Patescibacteria group bacterium]
MRRYNFLTKEGVYEALNRLRAAFLAAKDGHQVEDIIMSVLTHDERMKVGRRIQAAEMLATGATYEEVMDSLKIGRSTISFVERGLADHPSAFKLVNDRQMKVEEEFKSRAYRKSGGPKKVFKSIVYTGFSRKDVKR